MKIITLIISMLISTIGSAQSQIIGIYSIDSIAKNKNIECNIYFLKNGSYYLELSEQVSSDIIESLVLSYGKFSLTRNDITLIDKVHNYKMRLVKENKSLIVKQAYAFIINRSFVYSCSINSAPGFPSSSIDADMLQEERKNYKNVNKTFFPLYFGIYENEQGFKLFILQNNKYKLEFKDIILSEGTWLRRGNEIELKDLYLKHSFYILINGKMLISKLLPGDYKGLSLKKK